MSPGVAHGGKIASQAVVQLLVRVRQAYFRAVGPDGRITQYLG
jgi:hypothetical protein